MRATSAELLRSTTDDTPKRFEAYGWHVVPNVDGHDADAVKRAIEEARKTDKPSLICCNV